jgi:hypothetical protein
VGVVTEALAGGDMSRLEGLVSADCLAGLRQVDTPLDQRHLLVVRPEDVFFAFIPDLRDNEGAQRLLLGRGTDREMKCPILCRHSTDIATSEKLSLFSIFLVLTVNILPLLKMYVSTGSVNLLLPAMY